MNMDNQIKVFIATEDKVIVDSVLRGLSSDASAFLVSDASEADLVVVASDQKPGLELAQSYRVSRPDGYIIGYLRSIDPAAWNAAQSIGIDEVCSFGRLALAVRSCLAKLTKGELVRKVRLSSVSESAGRLGMIATVDSPEGGLVLFRISGGIYCVSERCPHAGISLSNGDIEGEILTCPAHGSQFSLTTGERVRGPADFGIGSFRVIEENGYFFALLPNKEG